MTKRTLISLLFAALMALTALSETASAQNGRNLSEAQRITGDRFTIATTTPKRANVYAVTRPSVAMLAAIDKGLTDLFAVSRKNRYARRLSYSDYTVFIARADREKNSEGSYSPDIAVGAAQYSGTDYDQGGYIFAAGMVVGFNQPAFVIADHKREFNRVSDIVRFEGEHLVLYHNDRRRYSETADHSKGGGHPILR